MLAEKDYEQIINDSFNWKEDFYAQAEMDLSEAYKHTSKIMSDNLLKDDAKRALMLS